jgi:hypothetical protein
MCHAFASLPPKYIGWQSVRGTRGETNGSLSCDGQRKRVVSCHCEMLTLTGRYPSDFASDQALFSCQKTSKSKCFNSCSTFRLFVVNIILPWSN